ncbi:MAG: hypothetical protein ACI88L_000017 [Candidatus Paceibacteria bacterium]|jgi:hypothetical protein
MKKNFVDCLIGSLFTSIIASLIMVGGVVYFLNGVIPWFGMSVVLGVVFSASLIALGITLPIIFKRMDGSTFTIKNEMNFTDLISKGTKLVLAGVIPSEGLKVQEKVLFRIEGKDNTLFFFRSPDTFTLAGVQPGARFRLEMKPKGGYTAHIEGEE